jgi:hypothetical protein
MSEPPRAFLVRRYDLVSGVVALLVGKRSLFDQLLSGWNANLLVPLLGAKALLIVVWAAHILPRFIVAFALPPFVTDDERTEVGKELLRHIRGDAASRGCSASHASVGTCSDERVAAPSHAAPSTSPPAAGGLVRFFAERNARGREQSKIVSDLL